MDARSQTALNSLHPKFRASALQAWTEAQANMPGHVKIVVIQGYRTFQQSEQLYAQGRTAPGPIVTHAPAGESYHNYGLAFDFAMITHGKNDDQVGPLWMKVVAIMKAHGMSWGGDFPADRIDPPHFENKYGYRWQELLALYHQQRFIPGTSYLQL
jgi:peptidoglycan L-alanyl-D-glutamate endopeptidase CwlK